MSDYGLSSGSLPIVKEVKKKLKILLELKNENEVKEDRKVTKLETVFCLQI
jgi:hypothetical protein